ncbi:MAG TPA: hypothetical protein VGP72_15660 [Planctomycetota bacterium]|jgi:hypothetical protein
MCYFITIVLDSRLDASRIAVAKPLSPWPYTNPNLVAQLSAHDALYCAMKGSCHCGTVLASAHQRQASGARYEEKTNKKLTELRRKGWSEHKIQRWLEQRESQAERMRHDPAAYDAKPEVSAWLSLPQAVHAAGGREFGVLLHFYAADVENENFLVKRSQNVSLGEWNQKFLTETEENVLYRVDVRK